MRLSHELYWLVATCMMTGLLWLPYILNRMQELGPLRAIWSPNPDSGPAARAWANRMQLAHANAVENLVVFAPLVLAVELLHVNTQATALACMVYFFARLGHFIVTTLALPLFRVILFLINVAAQMTLAVHLLSYTGQM